MHSNLIATSSPVEMFVPEIRKTTVTQAAQKIATAPFVYNHEKEQKIGSLTQINVPERAGAYFSTEPVLIPDPQLHYYLKLLISANKRHEIHLYFRRPYYISQL